MLVGILIFLLTTLGFGADFIGGSYYKTDFSCFYLENSVCIEPKKPEPEEKKEEKKEEKAEKEKIIVIYKQAEEKKEEKNRPKLKIGKWEIPVKEDIPEPVAKAIADPTEENILEALEFTKAYIDHMNRLKRVYETVALKYPDKFPRLYPVGLGEANWLNPLLEEVKKHQRKKIQERIGLVYFYRVSCPVCMAFKRFIVDLTDRGWLFLGVGVDAIDPTLPIKSVINPSLFERFRVVRVPTIVAIDKDTGLWRTVSVGLTPVDLIEKRIFEFAYDLGIIKEGIYEGFENVKVRLSTK